MVIRIQDTNNDGRISRQEFDEQTRDMAKEERVVMKVDGRDISGTLTEFQSKVDTLFSEAGDATSPSETVQRQVDSLKGELDSTMAAWKQAVEQGKEAKADELKTQAQTILQQIKQINARAARPVNTSSYEQQLGSDGSSDRGSAFKASVRSGGSAQGSAAQAGAQTGTRTSGTSGSAAFPPAGWSAQSFAAETFNSSEYLQSLAAEEHITESWDSVNQNTSRGKQLMQLFFYFAKMAESGDMGAMFQFMKFITYIVSKDKAKQQIEMGKKLIQLQDLSRQWTNKLLDMKSDSTDPSASNDLMKTMTIVKSETDAIATSQKLISQMMEEFGQVVETLTNVTQSALRTQGRIMQTVSRMS